MTHWFLQGLVVVALVVSLLTWMSPKVSALSGAVALIAIFVFGVQDSWQPLGGLTGEVNTLLALESVRAIWFFGILLVTGCYLLVRLLSGEKSDTDLLTPGFWAFSGMLAAITGALPLGGWSLFSLLAVFLIGLIQILRRSSLVTTQPTTFLVGQSNSFFTFFLTGIALILFGVDQRMSDTAHFWALLIVSVAVVGYFVLDTAPILFSSHPFERSFSENWITSVAPKLTLVGLLIGFRQGSMDSSSFDLWFTGIAWASSLLCLWRASQSASSNSGRLLSHSLGCFALGVLFSCGLELGVGFVFLWLIFEFLTEFWIRHRVVQAVWSLLIFCAPPGLVLRDHLEELLTLGISSWPSFKFWLFLLGWLVLILNCLYRVRFYSDFLKEPQTENQSWKGLIGIGLSLVLLSSWIWFGEIFGHGLSSELAQGGWRGLVETEYTDFTPWGLIHGGVLLLFGLLVLFRKLSLPAFPSLKIAGRIQNKRFNILSSHPVGADFGSWVGYQSWIRPFQLILNGSIHWYLCYSIILLFCLYLYGMQGP